MRNREADGHIRSLNLYVTHNASPQKRLWWTKEEVRPSRRTYSIFLVHWNYLVMKVP